MVQTWFKSLLRRGFGINKASRHLSFRNPSRRQIGLEALENRVVPAFLAPVSFPAGTNPAGIAIGDYNFDGKADMAVVNNSATGTVGIMLSNGDGTFQPQVDYAAGAYAFDAKSADFNKDGKQDLVISNQGAVSVLIGNGDGTFGAPATFATSGVNQSVQVGDFNNDFNSDIATVTNGIASVLLGNGDGSFQARQDAVFSGNAINAVVGDYNHDGNLDLATSNTTSIGTVTVLSGRGDGSFSTISTYYAYSAPVYLASGDFNHDGYDDFAVANSYAASAMSILLNNGDGTYGAPQTILIGQTGYEIEVEDFNNDGHDDYAVRGGSMYMVGLGKGDGTFYAPVNYQTTAGRFEMGTHGDFNGDGAVDLAYPRTSGVTVVMNANDGVSSLAGAVGFTVTAPSSTTSGSSLPMTISAIDADGNTVAGFRGSVYVTSSDPAAKSTFTYTFTAADAGTHTFSGSVKLVTQGDQTVTIASPLMTSSSVVVNVTPGISRFAVTAPSTSVAGETFNITVSALDSLGNVGTGYTSTVRFSSSDTLAGLPADYTFTPADAGVHTFAVTLKGAGSRYVGVTEVGSAISGGATVTVSAAATSSFSLAVSSGAIGVDRPLTVVARDTYGNQTSYAGTVHFTSTDPLAVLPADVPLAGGRATTSIKFLTIGTQTVTATDLADAAITGWVSSDATAPVAASFQVTGFPSATAGVAQNFTVRVIDTIGQTATGFTGTVYFSSSDMKAGLPASYTFTAADAGVHTFSATLKTAGTQSITVRDAFGTLTGSQMGISINAAAFSGFSLSVPNPTDSQGHKLVTAGEIISLTVRAVDSFGNSVVDYRGKIKFSSTDTQAGLPTDYGFQAADAGSHTFSVSLKTTTPNGVVWSFTVTDASNAATLATITNFEVMNAEAAKIVLNFPSNITAGSPFSLKVSILDAFGNRVKNYFGTIHFSSTAGSVGLPADYTFNSDDAGVHTFTVTLTTAGNQTITAVDLVDALLSSSTTVSVRTPSTGGGGGGGSGGGGGGKKGK